MPDSNGKKDSAYGVSSSDTSFRKTWDRSEYAAKAAVREAALKSEGKERYEAKLAGRKYIAPSSLARGGIDLLETQSRASRLDVSANVGKTTLVPAGASLGKRGKGAGFYCVECDLTFKDNLQYVDHLNSRQHLVATGQSGEVRRATLLEVRERLAALKRRREEEMKIEVVDLRERLEVAKEVEEREREERRRKRNEKRRKTEGGRGVKEEVVEGNGIIC